MLITVSNLQKEQLSINGLKVKLGGYEVKSVVVDGDVSKSTAQELKSFVDKGYLSYVVTEDADVPDDFEDVVLAMLHTLLKMKLLDAANVTGGGTTRTVGFILTDINDVPIKVSQVLQFAAFDDTDLTDPATNATLDTATKGTIIGGAGTPALKVKTDSNGEFACTLTDGMDETVYLGCAASFGSPSLICLSKDSITFSA